MADKDIADKLDHNKPIEESKSKSESKGAGKRRRRRNYDDYDAELAKEEEENKEKKQKLDESGKMDTHSDGDSDIDDVKLDTFIGNEIEEEDDLAEIDTSNIITTGRRTRGKIIDYKKTAEELDKNEGKTSEEQDDEEDEDADFKEL